ncbi:AAA family ATPase [Aquibium sp. ELW1220]|uniref:AAA family ATPase n=1 Tax=Aquibium sp. ELW1220 TaxID=2976766 RepID=UPI0025B08A38|nr:AAA family ATPase [Aquibium sp. ELW1220]MDN2584064.1 AAA family ATPase [Aquibium sp. ELW1220]
MTALAASTAESRADRAAEYASKWGGILVEQADGDWLVVGAITKLGTPVTVRFHAKGIARLDVPQGPLSKEQPQAANDNLPLVNPSDWQGKEVPERRWFVEGLIPMRQVTILAGDGGVGKSLLALQLGAASALSVDTLDMHPQGGRVVYMGAEDEADEFQRRLADILAAHGRNFADLADFRLVPLADVDALLSVPDRAGIMRPTPLWEAAATYCRDYRPSFIVLDTAADLFGGDEIKRAQVRQFIAMLRTLAIEIDAAIVLLAHPSVDGMRSGSGSSGSTAWNNSVRSRLYLTAVGGDGADPDCRILTTKKNNYGKTGGEIRLRWKDGAFVLDDGKASPTLSLLTRRHDEIFRTLLSAITRTGQRVAPTKGVNYAPSVMAERPEAAGVTKKQLEGAMHRLLAADLVRVKSEGPPSKRRQRLVLAAEDYGPAEDMEAA